MYRLRALLRSVQFNDTLPLLVQNPLSRRRRFGPRRCGASLFGSRSNRRGRQCHIMQRA